MKDIDKLLKDEKNVINHDKGWLTFNFCINFNQIYIYIPREYTDDLIHPIVPAHILSPDDNIHTQLFGCHLSNTFDYKFRPHSLLDLTDENYQINFDPILEKQNVEYKDILNEIQFNDSELNDIGIFKD
jgi:hypothetical protein